MGEPLSSFPYLLEKKQKIHIAWLSMNKQYMLTKQKSHIKAMKQLLGTAYWMGSKYLGKIRLYTSLILWGWFKHIAIFLPGEASQQESLWLFLPVSGVQLRYLHIASHIFAKRCRTPRAKRPPEHYHIRQGNSRGLLYLVSVHFFFFYYSVQLTRDVTISTQGIAV